MRSDPRLFKRKRQRERVYINIYVMHINTYNSLLIAKALEASDPRLFKNTLPVKDLHDILVELLQVSVFVLLY